MLDPTADRANRTLVDREKTCPFLLRVFVKPGSHHDVERDFQVPDRLPTSDESQLYAWKDTTLRDICLQLLDSNPSIKSNLPQKFSLRLVYLEIPHDLGTSNSNAPPARYKSQDLGTIFCRDLAHSISTAPTNSLKSLQDARFVVGDFIDVALCSPSSTSRIPGQPDPGKPNFGIRGAASGFASGAAAMDSHSGRRSAASHRWGSSDRRVGSGGFEASHHANNSQWGHNSVTYSNRTNGGAHRSSNQYHERGGPRWGNGGSHRRADSCERSPPRRRR